MVYRDSIHSLDDYVGAIYCNIRDITAIQEIPESWFVVTGMFGSVTQEIVRANSVRNSTTQRRGHIILD